MCIDQGCCKLHRRVIGLGSNHCVKGPWYQYQQSFLLGLTVSRGGTFCFPPGWEAISLSATLLKPGTGRNKLGQLTVHESLALNPPVDDMVQTHSLTFSCLLDSIPRFYLGFLYFSLQLALQKALACFPPLLALSSDIISLICVNKLIISVFHIR